MTTGRDPNRTFNRLLGRLLDGMVVPFVGAGVSINARHREIENLTDTYYMRERVVNALRAKCGSKSCENYDTCIVTQIENPPTFGIVCELWEWSCQDDNGQELHRRCKLVSEILKIPQFSKVEPTDAFYYIAFLVREGLIDEFITTNYDTCIEQAYRNTFGPADAAPEGDSPALVIDNLAEYRAKGGKRFTGGRNKRRCLKIYKINGCAYKLCKQYPEDGGCDKYCENILLTEKDLQDWRNRAWVRDLFCDRLRSRTILFSGFGSDEPQVRHTALQVCEEFASEAGEKRKAAGETASAIWEEPNAPFIAAFDTSLSFNQTQILQAYAQSFQMSLNPEQLQENAFLGSDGSFFCLESPEKLPADLFWRRVFQGAFWRLLRNACGRESAVVSFLSPVLPCAHVLLIEMLDWFDPKGGSEHNFGRFPEMLELSDEGKVIPLARWVHCVRRAQPVDGSTLYESLADRPVFIPVILLLIYLLIGEIPWEELKGRISGDGADFGLLVSVRDPLGGVAGAMYIVSVKAAHRLADKTAVQVDACTSVITQIVLGPWRDDVRKIPLVTDSGRLKRLTVRQISLFSLFNNARSVPDAKAEFHDMLCKTILLVDAARSRVRKRSRPLSSRRDEGEK